MCPSRYRTPTMGELLFEICMQPEFQAKMAAHTQAYEDQIDWDDYVGADQ